MSTSPGTTTWPRVDDLVGVIQQVGGEPDGLDPAAAHQDRCTATLEARVVEVATRSASRTGSVEEDAFIPHEAARAPRDNGRFRAEPEP